MRTDLWATPAALGVRAAKDGVIKWELSVDQAQ